MRSLIIEEGVEYLGNAAFAGCSNLKGVIIPQSVKVIAVNVFDQCHRLKRICYNAKDARLEEDDKHHVFTECGKDLRAFGTTLEIGAGVEKIPDKLFCPYLGNAEDYGLNICAIYVPLSLEELGLDTFKYLNQLCKVYYEGTEE
jgi:hypothetical protein